MPYSAPSFLQKDGALFHEIRNLSLFSLKFAQIFV